MASVNIKSAKSHVYEDVQLAGGFGARAAKQSEEMQLRRLVLTCLLWEDIAYADGKSVASEIKELCHTLPAQTVADIAIEARLEQKLRHVPLLLCRELARHPGNRAVLSPTMEKVIRRPDEMCEFLAIYWSDNVDKEGKKKRTLSSQVKKGLRLAFQKFDQYSLSKWDRDNKEVKLRDVAFLTHSRTKDISSGLWGYQGQGASMSFRVDPSVNKEKYKRGPVHRHEGSWIDLLVNKCLSPADTWEVSISAAKNRDEKRSAWERLLREGKLGPFALLKNLRNLKEADADRNLVAESLSNIKPDMLLPLDFLKAVKYAPEWTRELETGMLKCAAEFPKLLGWTVLVVDVSVSMGNKLSERSEFSRMDAAAAMAVLASEMCSHISVYATAGNDCSRVHSTQWINPLRGFALSNEILRAANLLGGGGIFTRQCLDFIRGRETKDPDRIIVFSDSQDCDLPNTGKPKPFGKRNYIVDVSSHRHGVNYDGVWTSEISGWSAAFLQYVAACESFNLN